jgi:superfamily II DNA or RNA helicase
LGEPRPSSRLGTITLRDHQREAAARIRRALEHFGGALLADDVGLGKTYTALAATESAGRLLVVAPAALRDMWRRALDAAHRTADFMSFESLSRAAILPTLRRGTRRPPPPYDVVVVDEAHHARNPATRRYERLAAICAGPRVLLLSATPVHNATEDLYALLALFLGHRAARMTPREIGECVVRRTRRDVPLTTTPARVPPVWLPIRSGSDASAMLDALLAIPAACPPRDGSDANALVTLGLVRAWSSSDAALRAVLRRRLARAENLGAALAAGRYPSRAELRAWVVGEDATQLAFPELVVPQGRGVSGHGFLAAVNAHAAGVRSALRLLAAARGASDDARCDLLRSVRSRHPGHPVVVFSHYAESVHAVFKRMVRDGGVGAVTARGAIVAGGQLSRHEALARFAPTALGARPPRDADAITLLIATDLLSEGLNLQDAGVVVHLDLPWTPARLAQRMGRVWRIGSRHAHVFEYAIAPPVAAERVAGVIARLERKASDARRALGDAITPLLAHHPRQANGRPTDRRNSGVDDTPGAIEAIRQTLATWVREPCEVRAQRGPPHLAPSLGPTTAIAAAVSTIDGWLAVIAVDHAVTLVAKRDERAPTNEPREVLAVVAVAGGATCAVPAHRVHEAMREVRGFAACMRGARDAGIDASTSHAHARISRRVGHFVASAAPHRRSAVSALAANARTAIGRVHGAGMERLLSELAASAPVDGQATAAEAWLVRVAELARASLRQAEDAQGTADEPLVPALLLLVSPPSHGG